jgi:hypothetical protein
MHQPTIVRKGDILNIDGLQNVSRIENRGFWPFAACKLFDVMSHLHEEETPLYLFLQSLGIERNLKKSSFERTL